MTAQLVPLLALGFLIERIMEIVVDLANMVIPETTKTDENGNKKDAYKTTIQIATFLGSLLAGIIITHALELNFFDGIDDVDTGRLLSGLLAGALAPYSHQVFEIVKKNQQRI